MMLPDIALILGAYLFGSIPFMLFIARVRGADLSSEDDLHIALWRKVGRLEGITGILLDFTKGILPILIGKALNLAPWVVLFAGFAAVLGQMWPVFRNFDGEKGNSIGIAMVSTFAFTYQAYPILFYLIPIIIGVSIRTIPRFFAPGQTLDERLKFGGSASLSLPIGMVLGFLALPLVSWWSNQPLPITLTLLALFLAIVLRRLTAKLSRDLKKATSVRSILINRLLFDRSYL